MWFSNFYQENKTIASFLVSSFANGSIFFMENTNSIFLFLSYSKFVGVKDWVK